MNDEFFKIFLKSLIHRKNIKVKVPARILSSGEYE